MYININFFKEYVLDFLKNFILLRQYSANKCLTNKTIK